LSNVTIALQQHRQVNQAQQFATLVRLVNMETTATIATQDNTVKRMTKILKRAATVQQDSLKAFKDNPCVSRAFTPSTKIQRELQRAKNALLIQNQTPLNCLHAFSVLSAKHPMKDLPLARLAPAVSLVPVVVQTVLTALSANIVTCLMPKHQHVIHAKQEHTNRRMEPQNVSVAIQENTKMSKVKHNANVAIQVRSPTRLRLTNVSTANKASTRT
jgi:hypothetical protein